MFKRVIEGVKSESERMGTAQIPWMNLSFTGEFCFAGCVDREADAREKEQLASRAKELENQLTQQQKQSEEFRLRMKEMETRLASKQQTLPQDTPEFKRLQTERAELAKKVAMLESQDQGLRKAQQSLSVFKQSQGELQKLEQELAVQRGRLQDVESQLKTSRSAGGTVSESVADLRKERDDLRKRIQELLSEKKKLENANKEISNVAQIAKESEQYNKELAGYRDRLAALERDASEKEKLLSAERARRVATEEKLKDANRATVRDAAIVAPAF
jgi:chromosome segregation ATPase